MPKTNTKKKAKSSLSNSAAYINLLGDEIYFPKNDRVLEYLNQGWYEATEQLFFVRYLKTGDGFIDCGAHAGLFSVLASNLVGKSGHVVALEPNTDILPYLEKNLGVNARSLTKVPTEFARHTIFKSAVADKIGKSTFLRGDSDESAFASLYYGSKTPRKIQVDVTTLDKISDVLNGLSLNLLKMDIEGGEFKALSKSKKFCSDHPDLVIMLEYSKKNIDGAGESLSDIKKLITSLGLKSTKYDASKNKLVPATLGEDNWYFNYFLTQNIDAANKRLAKRLSPQTKLKVDDFNQKSVASTKLYEYSNTTPKIIEIIHANVDSIAQAQFELSGSEEERQRVQERFNAFKAVESPEQSMALLYEFSDELGSLLGKSQHVTKSIADERTHLQALKIDHADLLKRLSEAERNAGVGGISPQIREGYLNEIERLNQQLAEFSLSTVKIDGLEQQMKVAEFEKDQLRQKLSETTALLEDTNKRWTMRNDFSAKRDEAYNELLKEFENLLSQLSQTENELRTQKKSAIKSKASLDQLHIEKDFLSQELKNFQKEAEQSEGFKSEVENLKQELAEKIGASEQHATQQDDQIKRLTDERHDLLSKIDAFHTLQDQMLNDLRNTHDAEIDKAKIEIKRLTEKNEQLTKDHTKSLEALQRKYALDIEKAEEAKHELEKNISIISEQHDASVEKLKTEYEDTVATLKDQIKTIQSAQAEQVDVLIKTHDSALEDLKKKHAFDIEANEQVKLELEEKLSLVEAKNRNALNEASIEFERRNGEMGDKISTLSDELRSVRQSLTDSNESSRKAKQFISKSSNELAELVEGLEDSRISIQKLIAITESAKSSRWARIGHKVGLGPRKTFETVFQNEHDIKAQINVLSGQLRRITEEHIEKSDGNYVERNSTAITIDETIKKQLLNDITVMGNSAQALKRSRLFKIAKFFRLKSADEISRMMDTYHGKNDS